MAIKSDIQVTFDVIYDDDYGVTKERVVIPKYKFQIAAEDSDFILLERVDSPFQEATPSIKGKEPTHE